MKDAKTLLLEFLAAVSDFSEMDSNFRSIWPFGQGEDVFQ